MKWLERIQQGSAPLRRVITVFVARDRKTGAARPLPTAAEEHSISVDGSPDTVRYVVPQVYDCLHSVEERFGGLCFDCGSQSCVQCHGSCETCLRPTCRECSRVTNAPTGSPVRMCPRCHGACRARRIAKTVGWVVISPFVTRKDPL